MSNLERLSQSRCFGGETAFYQHESEVCGGTPMRFAIYLPPQAKIKPLPVLYFLSGLTCTEENFMVKAGAQRYAAEYGLVLVVPDTSPRNLGIAGEIDRWDLGSGASFYVNASRDPWAKHYQMYSYVVDELPAIVAANFPVNPQRQGIMGHSMGGHGALICALRNPDRYQSVSAFAPIGAPSQCSWGQAAFSAYLGDDRSAWAMYDASELVLTYHPRYNRSILIDQGTADEYLATQLLPDRFEAACKTAGESVTLRYQEGYDHSYYFIRTFMGDHIRHHMAALID